MNGAGHEDVTIKSIFETTQQADGYSEQLDDLAAEIVGESDEDGPLADELADMATIEQLLDGFIQEVSEMFIDALDISLEGNPVRTHLELVNLGQDAVDLAHSLKRELIAKVANRSEVIAERGGLNLRTQANPPVIEES
jgi:hypothetical protein